MAKYLSNGAIQSTIRKQLNINRTIFAQSVTVPVNRRITDTGIVHRVSPTVIRVMRPESVIAS